jgi:undecaprenyl-diphosphatase
MDLFQAIILGIVQGATEYIPVSSSAHLVLTPWLLGWPDASFAFEVLVQWGTLVGVFVFFWQDIMAIVKGVLTGLLQRQPLGTVEARLGWLVVAATIPAVILGLLFKDFFEAMYSSPAAAGGLLIFTAILLVAAERYGQRLKTLEQLGWLDAVIIGLWQAGAMLPGISRSGATIGGAVLRGFNRTDAARFSFLMSIPALLGAGVIALKDLLDSGSLAAELPAITVGFIAAAISGYLCIRWLLHYLQRHSLVVFAGYCAAVSVLSVVVGLVRG